MRFALLLLPLLCLAQSPTGDFGQLSRQAAEALRADPVKALPLYISAVQLKPNWAEGWFYIGVLRYQNGQLADARQALTTASELDPAHGTVWAFLSLTEAGLHEIQPGYQHCVKGEKLGLADDMAFVTAVRTACASMALDAGAYSDAVAQLQPLAEKEDPPPGALDILGASVLQTSPQTTGAKHQLIAEAGQVAWDLYAHRTGRALSEATALVEKSGSQPGVHYLRGIVLLGEDPEAAGKDFRAELARNSGNVPARVQLGIQALRAKQPGQARKFALEAIQIDPANVLAQLVLGRALLDSGEPAEALPHLETAVKADPDQPEIHLFLEKAYRVAGQLDKAQAEKAEYQRLKAARNVQIDKAAASQ